MGLWKLVYFKKKSLTMCFIMVLLACLSLPQPVSSQDDTDLDDILEGFEDDEKSDGDLQEVVA